MNIGSVPPSKPQTSGFHLSFHQCPSSVPEINPGSHTAFSCPVCLVSSNKDSSLVFSILTLVKSTIQRCLLECPQAWVIGCFPWLNRGKGCWGRPQWCSAFPAHQTRGTRPHFLPFWGETVITSIPQGRWCLPDFTMKSLVSPLKPTSAVGRQSGAGRAGRASQVSCNTQKFGQPFKPAPWPPVAASLWHRPCGLAVTVCLLSSRSRLQGINTHALGDPREAVADGKHCLYLWREERVLRVSGLSKCAFPNEYLYLFALG